MPDETLNADVRFGRQVLLACAATVMIAAGLMGTLPEWWQFLLLGWVQCGAASVMVQVVTDFGYIRMVPRFDAVYSYTLSMIAGPISFIRTLLDLH